MTPRTRFSASSNRDLIQHLKDTQFVKSDYVFNLMCTVDRKHFTTDKSKAYIDAPHVIGYEKTIYSPHMHAATLELFADKLRSGSRALDIGSGTGYLTTCMALALGTKGFAVGIDCVPEFRDMARKIVGYEYPSLLTDNRIEFLVGNGKYGYQPKAPYDIIHVGAAAAEVPQEVIY